MTTKKQINLLLNQIIEVAEFQDVEFKRRMYQEHQAEKAIGEGWMVFHLKALREMMLDADK